MEDRVNGALLEPAAPVSELTSRWWEKFQLDLYDWNDPLFKKRNRGPGAYLPVPLTQGYFMIVERRDYVRMRQFPDGRPKKWRVKIDRNEYGEIVGIYAQRVGRGNEPATVYAHREILGILHSKGQGDHGNRWGLDNRGRANLRYVNRRENNCNRVLPRRTNFGLKTGVERRRTKAGKDRFGGIRAMRLGPRRVRVIRTVQVWLTQEPAHRWYLNQLKKLHKRSSWANDPLSVNFPTFPPSAESEPAAPRQNRREEVGLTIPF